jgi:hypothetical protein
MLHVRLVVRDGAKVCGGVVLCVWVWHGVENDIGFGATSQLRSTFSGVLWSGYVGSRRIARSVLVLETAAGAAGSRDTWYRLSGPCSSVGGASHSHWVKER